MKQTLSRTILFALFLSFFAPVMTSAEDEVTASRAEPTKSFELSETVKRALDRSAAQLVVKKSGDLNLELNGSYQHVYMARVGVGGKIETFCATHENAVTAWLSERSQANDK